MHEIDQHPIMSQKDVMMQMLEDGPEKIKDRVQEFCSDIRQLVKAMQVLFEQDSAALLFLGVKVTVKVTSEDLGELLHSEIGAQLVDHSEEAEYD